MQFFFENVVLSEHGESADPSYGLQTRRSQEPSLCALLVATARGQQSVREPGQPQPPAAPRGIQQRRRYDQHRRK